MKPEDLESIPESEGNISDSELELEIQGHLTARAKIINEEFGELSKVLTEGTIPDATGDQLRGALEAIQTNVIAHGVGAVLSTESELALSCAISSMAEGDTHGYEEFMDVVAGKALLIP